MRAPRPVRRLAGWIAGKLAARLEEALYWPPDRVPNRTARTTDTGREDGPHEESNP